MVVAAPRHSIAERRPMGGTVQVKPWHLAAVAGVGAMLGGIGVGSFMLYMAAALN